ncbi:MAG TPA: NrfD/PsrC family molybdoenzyme membrane anchor subunit, partial [Thermomicrobiales bacterium]|nr:NrfD/PsrC family molybdoenzyme membrane anchor subunit [Thermomicrobiales bacterium]
RSPMSVGSWTLTLFGAAATAVAGGQLLEDRPTAMPAAPRAVAARLAGPAAVAGAALGVLLSAYTGALLAATAVPLWAKRALLLGPLFVASAMATASAAINLALSLPRRQLATATQRIGLLEGICSASELAVLAAWTTSLGRIGKPLASGPVAPVFRHGVVGGGLAAPLALRALRPFFPRSIHRPVEIVTALLTLTGGLALRYVLVIAGAASADDPDATFALTARPQQPDAP